MLVNLRQELEKSANPTKAKILQRFFKTGKGQYGEGDIFLGITVPQSRLISQKFKDLSFTEIKQLIKSKIHEERLIALLILVSKFQKGSNEVKKEVYEFYLANTKYINNWDLVDLSAYQIVGAYLFNSKDKRVLVRLAKSHNIWERRIAIVATYAFIRRSKFDETFKIAEMLLNDRHDLIHKAVGWMLREVGKKDQKAEEKFLRKHYKTMPRTMLRYSIERFPDALRLSYLRDSFN